MARQKQQYNTRQVLELAIAVDAKQGFIKSGFGYYDRENEKRVYDNKTCILNFMQSVEGAEEFTITEDCVEQADKIVDEFKHELIAKKMTYGKIGLRFFSKTPEDSANLSFIVTK